MRSSTMHLNFIAFYLIAALCIFVDNNVAASVSQSNVLEWRSLELRPNGSHCFAEVSWSLPSEMSTLKCLELMHRTAGKDNGTRYLIDPTATYKLIPFRLSNAYDLKLRACSDKSCKSCGESLQRSFSGNGLCEMHARQKIAVTWNISRLNETAYNISWFPVASYNTVQSWSYRLSLLTERNISHSAIATTILHGHSYRVVEVLPWKRYLFEVAPFSDAVCRQCMLDSSYSSTSFLTTNELAVATPKDSQLSLTVTNVSIVNISAVALYWYSGQSPKCVSLRLRVLKAKSNDNDTSFANKSFKRIYESPIVLHPLHPAKSYLVQLQACSDSKCITCGAVHYFTVPIAKVSKERVSNNQSGVSHSYTGSSSPAIETRSQRESSDLLDNDLVGPTVSYAVRPWHNRTVQLTLHEKSPANVRDVSAGIVAYEVRFGHVKQLKYLTSFTRDNLSTSFSCSSRPLVERDSVQPVCYNATVTLPDHVHENVTTDVEGRHNFTVRWHFAVRMLKNGRFSMWSSPYGLSVLMSTAYSASTANWLSTDKTGARSSKSKLGTTQRTSSAAYTVSSLTLTWLVTKKTSGARTSKVSSTKGRLTTSTRMITLPTVWTTKNNASIAKISRPGRRVTLRGHRKASTYEQANNTTLSNRQQTQENLKSDSHAIGSSQHPIAPVNWLLTFFALFTLD